MAVTSGTCAICLGSIDTPGLGRHTLGCGHIFHENCIEDMRRFGSTGACPLCREELDELSPVQRVYEDAIVMRLRLKYQGCFQKLSEVLQLHAEHGNANAMMAELFDTGLGVPQDKQRAVDLYCTAISMGASLSGGHLCASQQFHETIHSYAKVAFDLALLSQEDNLTQATTIMSLIAAQENSDPLAMQMKNLCGKLAPVYHALAQSTNPVELFNQLVLYLPQVQYRTKMLILQEVLNEPLEGDEVVVALKRQKNMPGGSVLQRSC